MITLPLRLRALTLFATAFLCSWLGAAPTITQQPGIVNAESGQTAAFTVVATGSGAQTYQWRRVGTPITGANTPTLSLANVKMADAGLYDVVVTDGLESTVSQAGRLVVAPMGGYPTTLRLDTSFTPYFETAYSSVNSLSVGPSGEVYVGGNFSTIAGQRRWCVAKFNSALEIDPAFAPVFDGEVHAVLAQPDGKVLVGGTFTKVNGVAYHQIVRLNADGSIDGAFVRGSGFRSPVIGAGSGDGIVFALARRSDGRIWVGGNFDSVDGVSRRNLARLNVDGSLDASFGSASGADSHVTNIIVQSDGKVLIGGLFSNVGSSARRGLARLNFDGSLDTAFGRGPGFNREVRSLALQADGKVVVGGGFTTFNGTALPLHRSCRFNRGTRCDASHWHQFDGEVRAIAALSDGRIAASGIFRTYNGAPQQNLSVLTASGAIDTSFVPLNVPNELFRVFVPLAGGKFLAGGGFWLLGSTECSGLAKISASGAVELSAAAGFRRWSMVSTMVPVAGGKWVAAGNFITVNGTPRGRIARLNADGSLDTGFAAAGGFNDGVQTLAVQGDGRLLVGGSFTAFDGTPCGRIARLNADGTLDLSFAPTGIGFDRGVVVDIEIQADGQILVAGGRFTSFNGTSRNCIARLNTDGTLDNSFDPGSGFGQSMVLSLALEPGGRIVAGGDFSTYNGTARNRIVRLNADGSLDLSFNPGTGFGSYGVRDLVLTNAGRFVVGGDFNVFDGTSRKSIACLHGDGSLDTTFNSGSGFNGYVVDLTSQTDERIVVSGTFTNYNGTSRNFLARVQMDGTLDSTFAAYDLHTGVFYGTAYLDDGRMWVMYSHASRGATVQSGLVLLKPDLSPVANIVAPPVTQSASLGDTVTFTVGALGDGVLTYQWFKDGVAIMGATGSSLVLPNVQLPHVANYTVTVSNSFGSATSSPVTIYEAPPAPAITAQPADATIALGATATLGVTATGTAPLSYQWYRGESGDVASPVVGATAASFTTPALTAWARYWVRVVNRSSFADSATALVEVTGGTMTLADWLAQDEVPVDQRSPLDTPSGDGVSNLLKFALGVPPLDNAAAHLPVPSLYTQIGQPDALALLFTQNPGAQGIRYALEVSADLVTWDEVESVTEDLGASPDATQLVRLREAMPPAAIRRFARLKVVLTP